MNCPESRFISRGAWTRERGNDTACSPKSQYLNCFVIPLEIWLYKSNTLDWYGIPRDNMKNITYGQSNEGAYLHTCNLCGQAFVYAQCTCRAYGQRKKQTTENSNVGWLVGIPINCPLRRMWISFLTLIPSGIEPRAVAWQSITLPLRHASSTKHCKMHLTKQLIHTWLSQACILIYRRMFSHRSHDR